MNSLKSKKKIVFIFSTAQIAGAENILAQIILGLKTNFEFIAIFFRDSGPISDLLSKNNIETKIILGNLGLAYNKLRQYLNLKRPDMTLVCGIKIDFILRLFKPFNNFGYYTTIIYGLTNTKKISKLIKFFQLITCRFVDTFLFCSQLNANYYFNTPKIFKKIKVIRLGITYLSNKETHESSEKFYERSDDCFKIMYVANMRVVKNQKFLVNLFLNYENELKDCKLYLVGNGPQKNELIKYCKMHNIKNVFIPDNRFFHDIIAELKKSDLFISSSYFEGQPLSFMEAMIAGLPIVAYQNGQFSGNAELVHENVNGLLLYSLEPNLWVKAINKIKNDKNLRIQMGQKSIEMMKELTVQQMLDNYKNFFNLNKL